jgi:hypothetical protein
MLNMMLQEVFRPLARRAGTAFGGYLLGIGVHSDTSTQIVAGITALAGVILDLTLSHFSKKAA